MFNGLIINPAYCGSSGVLDATISYKNQWTGFGVAPKTLVLGLNSPLKNESSNVGILLLNDQFAITNKNRVLGSYAYRIKLNDKINLRFGIQAGFESIRNNYNQLTIIESGDASFSASKQTSTSFITGTGVYIHSEKWFSGISLPVLYSTVINGNTMYKPLLIYGGIKNKINDDFSIQPSLLIKYIKNSPPQLDINVLLLYQNKYGAGLSYRTSKTIVGNLFYQINQQFYVGYAVDINTGKLSGLASTSHEIILKYQFGYLKNLQNPKTFY